MLCPVWRYSSIHFFFDELAKKVILGEFTVRLGDTYSILKI